MQHVRLACSVCQLSWLANRVLLLPEPGLCPCEACCVMVHAPGSASGLRGPQRASPAARLRSRKTQQQQGPIAMDCAPWRCLLRAPRPAQQCRVWIIERMSQAYQRQDSPTVCFRNTRDAPARGTPLRALK